MQKVSSKLIISFLLAILLWTGVGFDFGVKRVEAAAITAAERAQIVSHCNSSYSAKADISKCIANLIKQKQGPSGVNNSGGWFIFREGFSNMANFTRDAVIKGFAYLIYVILLACNKLLALAGNLFDTAMYYSIYMMSDFVGASTAIPITWAVIRNMINITFIFILLWVAIKTILGLSSANTKKMISGVVVAALLINFSLFITRIIIDGGNLVADALYQKTTNIASSNQLSVSGVSVANTSSSSDKYISTSIMNSLKLQTIYSMDDSTTVVSTTGIIMNIFSIVLALVASYAFFFASFMFIGRLIAFFLLMVLSPIGFIGDIIPYMKPHSEKWWKTLINQTLVAPVFLLFMYMLIMLGQVTTLSASMGSEIDVGLYINFAIIIGLLITAVKVTKDLSGEVGGVMTSLGGKALGFGLGLATGGLAMAGRNVIGRSAAKWATSDSLTSAAKAGGLRGMGARLALRGATATSKASFDARNTSSFKAATESLAKQTGINVDYNRGIKVAKDGFQGQVDRSAASQVEVAKMINKGRVNLGEDEVANTITERRNKVANSTAEIQRLRQEDNLSSVAKEEIVGLNKEIVELEKKKSGEKNTTKLKQLQEEIDKRNRAVNKIKSTEDNLSDEAKEKLAEARKNLATHKAQELDTEKVKKELIKNKKADKVRAYAAKAKASIINKTIGSAEKASEDIEKVAATKDFKTLAAEALAQKEKEEAALNPPPPATH